MPAIFDIPSESTKRDLGFRLPYIRTIHLVASIFSLDMLAELDSFSFAKFKY
jgi:hypothetical protein